MKKIKLLPLVGLDIETLGEVKFGENKQSIIAKLGKPSEEEDGSLYYDNLEIRIDFDEQNAVEFIEIYGPDCVEIEPTLYKINPFSLEANELIKFLTTKNNGNIDDTEQPLFYIFYNLEIGIWREVSESQMKNEIKAARDNGEYEHWMDEDLEKSKYFWTIGLGTKGYYQL